MVLCWQIWLKPEVINSFVVFGYGAKGLRHGRGKQIPGAVCCNVAVDDGGVLMDRALFVR